MHDRIDNDIYRATVQGTRQLVSRSVNKVHPTHVRTSADAYLHGNEEERVKAYILISHIFALSIIEKTKIIKQRRIAE